MSLHRKSRLCWSSVGGGEGLDMDRCVSDLARLAAIRPLVVVTASARP